jgi:RNA polymerase sigma factor (sigma-70 family)
MTVTDDNHDAPTATPARPAPADLRALQDLRRRVLPQAQAAPATPPAPATAATPTRRRTNGELLAIVVSPVASPRAQSDAAEALWRNIRPLCAAAIDRHTAALTAQEAEDLVQEVFLRLLRAARSSAEAAPAGAPIEPTPAYLSRIAVNVLIDQRRSLHRRGLDQPVTVSAEDGSGDPLHAVPDPSPAPEDDVIERLHQRDIETALRRALKNPTEAAVVRLRLEGASHDEIAAELHIKTESSRKHWQRGVSRLRSLVELGHLPALSA